MKNFLFVLLLFATSCGGVKQQQQDDDESIKQEYNALEVISWAQLVPFDSLNFELSGIAKIGNQVFVVADKQHNTFLYEIQHQGDDFSISHKKSLVIDERLDLEAVDGCGHTIYLANEYNGAIYRSIDQGWESINIDFESIGQDLSSWGNAGWEGLTVDCENKRMYLVKERQPRMIFVVDMETWKVIDQFDVPHDQSNDFSDAKFDNGYLYLIERNGTHISKIDPRTHQVIDKYHYKKEASHDQGKLYGPEEYGMAEALLITKDEIWIGWDNNGREVTEHAKSKYGMKKNMPVIFKFKRPIGF